MTLKDYLHQIEALSLHYLKLTLAEINFVVSDEQFSTWNTTGVSVEQAFLDTFFWSLDALLTRKGVML